MLPSFPRTQRTNDVLTSASASNARLPLRMLRPRRHACGVCLRRAAGAARLYTTTRSFHDAAVNVAVAATAAIVCGGQGARRKRNWRHNRPNSPYNLARMASGGLCPAQQAALARGAAARRAGAGAAAAGAAAAVARLGRRLLRREGRRGEGGWTMQQRRRDRCGARDSARTMHAAWTLSHACSRARMRARALTGRITQRMSDRRTRGDVSET